MDLWQLTIFCSVIEQKSFSKAGRRIHLSQPTVSSHIKDLEDHFGCRLIDRLSREAVPTREGRVLYGYARRLIALKKETESAMAECQGTIRGQLSIGGSTIPGGYLLPKMIGEFYREYPDVSISLTIGDTKDIIEKIGSGQLELGIVGARTTDKRIVQERTVTDMMRLIVAGDHQWADRGSVSLKRLKTEPFIIRERGSGTLKSIRRILAGAGYGIGDLNVVAEMGNTVAVIQGIKNHVGVSILSTIAVADEIEAGTLKALEIYGFKLERHLYLTRHRQRTPSPLNRAFHSFIREKFYQPPSSGDELL